MISWDLLASQTLAKIDNLLYKIEETSVDWMLYFLKNTCYFNLVSIMLWLLRICCINCCRKFKYSALNKQVNPLKEAYIILHSDSYYNLHINKILSCLKLMAFDTHSFLKMHPCSARSFLP